MTGEGSTLAIELGSSITPLPIPQRSTDVVDAFANRAVSAGDDLTITLIPHGVVAWRRPHSRLPQPTTAHVTTAKVRTDFGRPAPSIRLSTSTAMATSAC